MKIVYMQPFARESVGVKARKYYSLPCLERFFFFLRQETCALLLYTFAMRMKYRMTSYGSQARIVVQLFSILYSKKRNLFNFACNVTHIFTRVLHLIIEGV